MSLKEKATKALAKLNEIGEKKDEVAKLCVLIIRQDIHKGATFELPDDQKQQIDGFYETAKAELLVLFKQLP